MLAKKRAAKAKAGGLPVEQLGDQRSQHPKFQRNTGVFLLEQI
jgi:energy-converting hydrogenase Eha subunit F